MDRWTSRFCMAGMMFCVNFFGCDGSSASDSDGGVDAGSGMVAGGGGVPGGSGGATAAGGQGTSLQGGDGGLSDLFSDSSPHDIGSKPRGVPLCEASVQQDVSCTVGPDSACIPASGGRICLCPTGKWMCF